MSLDTMFRWVTSLWTDATPGGAETPTAPRPDRDRGQSRKRPPPRSAPANGVSHPIARALLAHAPSPTLNGRRSARRPVRLEPVGAASRSPIAERDQANAWLFGVFFDHMIPADQAWRAPHLLAERLGHLDVRRIARGSVADLQRAIVGGPREKALHRLHPRLARNLHAASVRLVRDYDGEAENLWPDGLPIEELRRRLRELSGLGPKLTSMAIRTLVDDFGRTFRGWETADVAVDRHVARVFLRTGLVDAPSGERTVSVSQIHDDAVRAARVHCAVYPAALDFPAFEIGQRWCKANTPDCGGCPLRAACPQERKAWRIR